MPSVAATYDFSIRCRLHARRHDNLGQHAWMLLSPDLDVVSWRRDRRLARSDHPSTLVAAERRADERPAVARVKVGRKKCFALFLFFASFRSMNNLWSYKLSVQHPFTDNTAIQKAKATTTSTTQGQRWYTLVLCSTTRKPWESCLNTPTDMLRTLSQEDMLGKLAASDKPHKQHTWTPSVSVAQRPTYMLQALQHRDERRNMLQTQLIDYIMLLCN